MNKEFNLLFAGFGGQGTLFAGQLVAYAGMVLSKKVSWLPSYGPEMRGGTANCSVIVSEDEIASPLVLNPTDLIAMNSPSFDKFEASVTKGGIAVVDSSLVLRKAKREDINVFYIPATQLAIDNNMKKLANVIILGKLIKENKMFTLDEMKYAIEKYVMSKKPNRELVDLNIKALELGYNF